MSEWISVKERMPESNGKYLVVVAGDKIFAPYVVSWFFFNGKFEEFQSYPAIHITHWTPLPEPPEVEDGNT